MCVRCGADRYLVWRAALWLIRGSDRDCPGANPCAQAGGGSRVRVPVAVRGAGDRYGHHGAEADRYRAAS